LAKEKKKKRLTDSERMVAEIAKGEKDEFNTGSAWFKDEVDKKKGKIKINNIDKKEKEAKKRPGKEGIFHLKDICEILDWQFPRDKEERNRLAWFSNFLQIAHGADAPRLLWNGMVACIKRDDIINPTDMFLSKKEARKGKARKKREKKYGETRNISVPKTDEEKKAARKERNRIRKEAKKLGITSAEYKARLVFSRIQG
jgi:hypothetical protein